MDWVYPYGSGLGVKLGWVSVGDWRALDVDWCEWCEAVLIVVLLIEQHPRKVNSADVNRWSRVTLNRYEYRVGLYWNRKHTQISNIGYASNIYIETNKRYCPIDSSHYAETWIRVYWEVVRWRFCDILLHRLYYEGAVKISTFDYAATKY